MPEPTEPYVLSGKGLEEIRRRVTGTCGCCGENVHDFDVSDVLELLDDVDRLRSAAYDEAVEKYATDMAERARIWSMEIRGGTFNLSLEDAQEMCAAYVATARTMLGDAENYSETRVDFPKGNAELEVKLAGELDRYVLTVQRAGKLTPHEARVKAEEERDAARAELAALKPRDAEWGYGLDASDVKLCGTMVHAYERARTLGQRAYARTLYASPWRPEDGDDDE